MRHGIFRGGEKADPSVTHLPLELGAVRLLQPENLEAVKRVVKEEEMPAAPISASNAFNSRYIALLQFQRKSDSKVDMS